jgi:hypothetical protein
VNLYTYAILENVITKLLNLEKWIGKRRYPSAPLPFYRPTETSYSSLGLMRLQQKY